MSSKINTSEKATNWLGEMGSSIALLDNDFNFVAATDGWFKVFELQDQKTVLTGKSIFKIFPELSEAFETRLNYALEGLRDIQLICRVDKNPSFKKDSIWYFNPWKNGYGQTIGVTINIKPLSERRTLELDLKKTKHLLNQKSEIAKIGTWEYDVEENKLIWSDKVKEIHGLSKHYDPDFYHTLSFYKEGASYMTIKRAFAEAIENAKPWNEMIQLVTLDGQVKWVNSIGRPKFKNGKCRRILGTLQEVEDSGVPKAIKAEGHSLDFKSVFELAPMPMALCEYQTGKVVEVNSSLLKEFGLRDADVKRKIYGNHISILKSCRLRIARSLLTKGSFKGFKTSFVKVGTTACIVEISGNLLNLGNGKKMILATLQRVKKKESEEQSNALSDTSTHELKKLVNFNHMMAHNLRNHATNISMLLNFYDKETDKDEKGKMMRLMYQSTEQLMNEIKVLRQMVAIGENKGLKKVSMPLNDFILNAEYKLSKTIRKENAKIFNDVPEHLNIDVIPVYMESIIVNILSNALEFRKEDKNPIVIINAVEDENFVKISIEDNGVGIDLGQHKDRIFTLYQTINSNDSSGIGLYLAKYQMELMNGSIEVESQVGTGTTFTLFLPKYLAKNNQKVSEALIKN